MTINEYKSKAVRKIDEIQDELWKICGVLYENPEIGFKEYKSSELLRKTLIASGFIVDSGIAGLETAFRGIKNGGKDRPIIAFLAEFDALPGLGHACGHNLIAAAAIGAASGLLEILDQLPGSIMVIGTPAEEGGGGKKIIAKAGYFDDVDAALMFHPASKNIVSRGSLASSRLKLEFFGKASHAAAAPEDGINALDACLLTFNNINAMRHQLKFKERIAGIITHGGDAANIIPAFASAEFSIRGETTLQRDALIEKVIRCAQAGTLATGCSLEYKVSEGYSEIRSNLVLIDLFTKNLEQLGRTVAVPDPFERMGSTDMGDVSWIVPSIHPYLAAVPEGIAGHTVEFREMCMTPTGKLAMLDAAKAMAMTAVDLLIEDDYLQQARIALAAVQ